MGSGLGLGLTTFSSGTTISSSSMNSNFSSINSSAISNDNASITTDGSGHITADNGYLTSFIMLSTPYQLTSNPTLNSGSTTTLSCTGGSTGVPSGASAVMLGIGLFSDTSGGGYVTLAPHGGTQGDYWGLAGPNANQYTLGFGICPVDSNGQIDVKANGQNCVLQTWYIIGYVM